MSLQTIYSAIGKAFRRLRNTESVEELNNLSNDEFARELAKANNYTRVDGPRDKIQNKIVVKMAAYVAIGIGVAALVGFATPLFLIPFSSSIVIAAFDSAYTIGNADRKYNAGGTVFQSRNHRNTPLKNDERIPPPEQGAPGAEANQPGVEHEVDENAHGLFDVQAVPVIVPGQNINNDQGGHNL